MFPAPIDELERLQHLDRYRIGGTEHEVQFDHIAHLTANLFSAPIAAISIVGAETIWLKARVGIQACDMPRGDGFCAYAIMQDTPLVVPDLQKDVRFVSNPFVRGSSSIKFYAGAPLIVPGGHRIGTLCVMDTVLRPMWSARDEAQLAMLASLVVDHLELRRLELTNAIARGFTDATHDALLCIDANGIITFVNQAALDMFGYASPDMIGQKLAMIVPERFRSAHAGGVARIAEGHSMRLEGRSVELFALRRDGHEFPIEISICSWRDQHGVQMGASLRDISERKQRDQRLHRLAHQDPLTGLANQLQFEDGLATLCNRGSASILLLGLDGFKTLNDTLGSVAGDALLQTLAIRLQATVEEGAILARLRGDEFAVALPGVRDPLRVRACAESILSALEAPFRVSTHTVRIDMRIGAAIAPDHGADAEELVASADLALSHAKSETGSRFRLFEPAMRNAVAARRALQDELIRAFECRELVLHYQPQLRLDTQQLIGAEALLRWQHPHRGLLLPGAFISVLDHHALALDVGDWTIDEACRQLAAWRRSGLGSMRIGVNLFAAQLTSGTLLATVEGALARHRVEAGDLELEVTETIALQNEDRIFATLGALRARGVRLAFDDFGTGFASLSTLKRVPLTTLKIDRSFVHGIIEDEQDTAVVAAVAGMGRRLGLEVVAEGIETAEQEACLARLGCVVGQGFRYGLGTPADEFAREWHASLHIPHRHAV